MAKGGRFAEEEEEEKLDRDVEARAFDRSRLKRDSMKVYTFLIHRQHKSQVSRPTILMTFKNNQFTTHRASQFLEKSGLDQDECSRKCN